MKKLLSLLLVLILAIGVIASCGGTNKELEAAGEYLDALYKNESANTTVDYDVVANVVYNGVTYPVTWTVNVDAVTIVDSAAAGFKTVKVTRGDADLPYTLSASITDGEDTITKTFDRIVPAKASQASIVEAAYALAKGDTMEGTQTLTGKIISIDTPYDTGYKNVTVTIVVENLTDKPIMCYRLKGDEAANLKVGDTITVEGTIKNYNGTIEFDAGCLIKAYTAWVPTEAEKVAFEKAALTLPEIVYMDGNVALAATGATYTDVTVTWGATGATINAGNLVIVQTDAEQTVTLTATLACGTATDTKTITVKIAPKDIRVAQPVTALDPAKTYVLAIDQLKLNKRLFATGEMDGYYAATHEAKQLAAAVKVELVPNTTDKYFLKITVGTATKYVNMVTSTSDDKTYVNIKLEDTAATQYTFNATYGALVASVANADYFFGVAKDKTHDTFGPVAANADNYPAKFFELVNPDMTPAADRIEAEKSALNLPLDITTAELSVPNVGTNYNNVTITWTSSNPAVTVGQGKLNFALPATVGFVKDVTITATIACEGAASATKDFTVTLWKMPTTQAETVDLLYALESGMSIPGAQTLTGRVVNITDPYGSFNNVTFVIVLDRADTTKPVVCCRIKGDHASDVKIGDTVTLTGTLINYNGTKEFNSDSKITARTEWVPANDAEKVAYEKHFLDVNTTIDVDTALTLVAAGERFTDVAITWTADTVGVSGTYNVALGDAARQITLVATLTCNGATDTKTFVLEVAKKSTVAPVVADELDANTTYYFVMDGSARNQAGYLYLDGGIASNKEYRFTYTSNATSALGFKLEAGANANEWKIYFMDGEVKTYVNLRENGNYENCLYETEADMTAASITPTVYTYDATNHRFTVTIGEVVYAIGTTSGTNGYFEAVDVSNQYLRGTVAPATLVEASTLSGADKIAAEKNWFNPEIPSTVTSATQITLPTAIGIYEDVVITWAATGATVVENKVDLAPTAVDQTITLTATFSCAGATDTKVFTVSVPKLDNRVSVPVTTFAADTAYVMKSEWKGAEVYFDGTKPSSASNLSVTTIKTASVSVYLTATANTGEFYLYILDGTTKHYLTVSDNKFIFTAQTEANVVPAAATLLVYDSTNGAWRCGSADGRFIGSGNSTSKADIRTYAASNVTNTTSYPHMQLVTFQEPSAQ